MPIPTTHLASNQSSQLAHPSSSSNPALMDDSSLPSLHLDTSSLPTNTRVHPDRRRRREPSPSPPLSPASSTSHQHPVSPTHSNIRFTLFIYPYHSRRRFAALIPRLFGNSIPGHITRAPPMQTQPALRVGFKLVTDSIQLYVFVN